MTQRRALEILHTIWGCGQVIDPGRQREIDTVALPDERPLDTITRIGCVSVGHVQPFDTTAIFRIASRALALLDIQGGRS